MFWLQWHGSHAYDVLTSVCPDFLARRWSIEDHEEVAEAQEQFEVAEASRGVYTSQSFSNANSAAVPLLVGGGRYMAKFMLLVAIPGDLSDDGVAVNFNTGMISGHKY